MVLETRKQLVENRADRIIGRFDSGTEGPLLICIGAMHGNEPAGVRAIELVLKMLDVEPIKNPSFSYKGRFLGVIGNLKAFNAQQRFLDKDLNRYFSKTHLENLHKTDPSLHDNEDK